MLVDPEGKGVSINDTSHAQDRAVVTHLKGGSNFRPTVKHVAVTSHVRTVYCTSNLCTGFRHSFKGLEKVWSFRL